MSPKKFLMGILVLALGSALIPSLVYAQCGVGVRSFASIGGGSENTKVRVQANVAWNAGDEIGRWWQCTNSTLANNWSSGGDANLLPDPAGCASNGGTTGGSWWNVTQTSQRGFEGVIDGISCMGSGLNGCPDGDFCVLVEDYGPGGPPGVFDDAYFIAIRVDETPPFIRYWDLAKVHPEYSDTVPFPDPIVLPFAKYPVPFIVASAQDGIDRLLTVSFPDIFANAHVANPADGPNSGLVATWDLMIHTGNSDPGRDRHKTGCGPPNPFGRCWNLVQTCGVGGNEPCQLPYEDAALLEQQIKIPCDSAGQDSYIALALSFNGGNDGAQQLLISSALVGKALQIECDPNIAEPTPVIRPGLRSRSGSNRPDPSLRGGRR